MDPALALIREASFLTNVPLNGESSSSESSETGRIPRLFISVTAITVQSSGSRDELLLLLLGASSVRASIGGRPKFVRTRWDLLKVFCSPGESDITL